MYEYIAKVFDRPEEEFEFKQETKQLLHQPKQLL